jgi:hypothetical protein
MRVSESQHPSNEPEAKQRRNDEHSVLTGAICDQTEYSRQNNRQHADHENRNA